VRCGAQSGAAERCDAVQSGVGGGHSPPDSQKLCAGLWW
jgi:hypothetical protein